MLPLLEDTLVDLLRYGDTGALRVQDEICRWTFYVQGGVLIGVEREPPEAHPEDEDPTGHATAVLAEAMGARNALWDFEEGGSPEDFGLFDARHALTEAMCRARELPDLLGCLQPLMDAWPRLTIDPDTLTEDPEIQAWLRSLDGLGPGSERLTHAPSQPARCLAVVWLAWKMGEFDLGLSGSGGEDLIDDGETQEEAALDDDTDLARAHAAHVDPHEPFHESFHEEGAEGDELSHTHQTELLERGPPPPHQAPEAVASPTRDPLVEGIALARAGSAEQALPLLEEAWEDDPDRPGLEEWLGYTRFTACRESDSDVARAGLTMLRDVMYRTGPTGDPPTLPWLLMARAQLERGDLLQARSVLDGVLAREPGDPEAQHLDSRLKSLEAEAEALRQRPKGTSMARVLRLSALLGLATAIGLVLQVVERQGPPRTDYSAQFAQIVPLRELHRVPRGWVGVAQPGWAGETSPTTTQTTCWDLAEATHMDASETLTLLSDAGVVLAECGERLE